MQTGETTGDAGGARHHTWAVDSRPPPPHTPKLGPKLSHVEGHTAQFASCFSPCYEVPSKPPTLCMPSAHQVAWRSRPPPYLMAVENSSASALNASPGARQPQRTMTARCSPLLPSLCIPSIPSDHCMATSTTARIRNACTVTSGKPRVPNGRDQHQPARTSHVPRLGRGWALEGDQNCKIIHTYVRPSTSGPVRQSGAQAAP